MKHILILSLTLLSFNSYAKENLDKYDAKKIEMIKKQADADYASIKAFEEQLDALYKENALMRDIFEKQAKEMSEQDVSRLKQASKEIQETTNKATEVIKEAEEKTKEIKNRRQGFGTAR